MFKKLAKQLKMQNDENSCFPMSSPMRSLKEETKKSFLKSLSCHALNLYERKTDINNFTPWHYQTRKMIRIIKLLINYLAKKG